MYVSLIVEMTERHSSFIYNQVSAEEPVRWTLPWGRMNSVSISSGTHWPTVTKTSWALLKLRLELRCKCCWIISKNHHESLITVSTRHTISRQASSNVVVNKKCECHWHGSVSWDANLTLGWALSPSPCQWLRQKRNRKGGRNHLFTMYQDIG